MGHYKPKNSTSKSQGFTQTVFDWLDVAVASIVFVVIVLTFIIRVVNITGQSMENTLHDGQKVIISHALYTPQRGDIVVISREADADREVQFGRDKKLPLIKRIIATEGETVEFVPSTGVVYVDGVPLYEPYIKNELPRGDLPFTTKFPVTVPKGCVFVMGDNRNNSLDSRYAEIGMIDTRYILGKAVYRILPFGQKGPLS